MKACSAKMEEGGKREKEGRITYCVTGANGFIGSWLVKTLLEDGYTVHATVRHPEKCEYLSRLWAGTQRFRLFKADLNEEGSFDEAINGCHGVFHVAAFMEFCVDQNKDNQNIDKYVGSKIIDPQIKGIQNLLKSCLKTKSIKRVIFTSSISTITGRDNNGGWRPVIDELSRTRVDHVWQAKPSGWVYIVSKILTEEAAYKFSSENGISLISIITSTVSGPFLTRHLPLSIRVALSPLTDPAFNVMVLAGEDELFRILSSVNNRMGSIGMVHIEDVCKAHIFLMKHPRARGPYICCADSCTMSKLVGHLTRRFPTSCSKRIAEEESGVVPKISSKKLRDLGFEYKHGIEDIIHQTITHCVANGFLSS